MRALRKPFKKCVNYDKTKFCDKIAYVGSPSIHRRRTVTESLIMRETFLNVDFSDFWIKLNNQRCTLLKCLVLCLLACEIMLNISENEMFLCQPLENNGNRGSFFYL